MNRRLRKGFHWVSSRQSVSCPCPLPTFQYVLGRKSLVFVGVFSHKRLPRTLVVELDRCLVSYLVVADVSLLDAFHLVNPVLVI